MENNLKYFQPEISDIHIGYECECLWCCVEPKPWIPIKVTSEDNHNMTSLPIEEVIYRLEYDIVEIRTPYLTKEQIEAEGWVQEGESPNGNLFRFTKIVGRHGNAIKWSLTYYRNDKWLAPIELRYRREDNIFDSEKDKWQNQISEPFSFECNSINEFRKIQKWLKIC